MAKKDAEAAVAESLSAAADSGEGLAATVTQDVPSIRVKVKEGNVVGHEGKMYGDHPDAKGDTVELDGPSAIALIQLGHVVPA